MSVCGWRSMAASCADSIGFERHRLAGRHSLDDEDLGSLQARRGRPRDGCVSSRWRYSSSWSPRRTDGSYSVARRAGPSAPWAARGVVDDTARLWWLRKFTDEEIATMAAAMTGCVPDLPRIASERERLSQHASRDESHRSGRVSQALPGRGPTMTPSASRTARSESASCAAPFLQSLDVR
jgi:hypothetical protein